MESKELFRKKAYYILELLVNLWSYFHKNLLIVQYLIEKGVNIEAKEFKDTPLHIACEKGAPISSDGSVSHWKGY